MLMFLSLVLPLMMMREVWLGGIEMSWQTAWQHVISSPGEPLIPCISCSGRLTKQSLPLYRLNLSHLILELLFERLPLLCQPLGFCTLFVGAIITNLVVQSRA